MKKRSPVHQRNPEPPGMRLTDERDVPLLQTIDLYEGVLAEYQIAKLFFKGVSERTVRDRLRTLFDNGYLDRPNKQLRGRLDCMAYWLGPQGRAYLATIQGIDPRQIKLPRLNQIQHEILVNDVRLAFKFACEETPAVVDSWISAREFLRSPDQVRYQVEDGRWETRFVRPDGYCVVSFQDRKKRRRFLIEVDRATEDNPRFIREKVIPGFFYLRSEAYKNRVGTNTGSWLVVTTTERRLAYMKRMAEQIDEEQASSFYYTTFEKVKTKNILKDPIWIKPNTSELVSLYPPDLDAN